MGEFRTVSFGDLGQLFDGPHATPTRREEGPYFLNISSLKAGRLDLAQSDHVGREDFAKWTRRVTPREGDLLFSYETRLGEAALMPAGVEACLGRRMALLRPDRKLVDPRFLLYYYLSPSFQRVIEKHTIYGATVPRIGLATMPQWELEIPDLPTQQAIAEVLGALDDKIAANNRIIVTAEELMVALAASSAQMASVVELAEHRTKSVKPEAFDPRVAHFSLPAFDEGRTPCIDEAVSIKSNKFVLTDPCVLVSKLNPRIPRIWDVPVVPGWMAVASTEFVMLIPKGTSTTALWAALKTPAVSASLRGLVAGTSGSHQRVKPAELLTLPVPDPRALAAGAQNQLASLGTSVNALRDENLRLAATRDELLPLLVSGKLHVTDAI